MVCQNRENWSPEKLTTSYNHIIALGADIAGNVSAR